MIVESDVFELRSSPDWPQTKAGAAFARRQFNIRRMATRPTTERDRPEHPLVRRRFQWRFFPDHIEFQQFASGHGKLGRSYFLSNGVSNRWDNGSTGGRAWTTTVYADRYFSPSPNHANQFEFNIAMPQTLGFSDCGKGGSDADFRPERITGIFAPPLFLAFQLNKT
jgi:hypothetical protein